MHEKSPAKSAPKERGKSQSTATVALHQKEAASTQVVVNIVEILKEFFASLSQSMSEGFDNLGQMLQDSGSEHVLKESNRPNESPSDSDGSDVEEPAAKKRKSDEAGQSTENEAKENGSYRMILNLKRLNEYRI